MPNYELEKLNKTVNEANIHLCQYCGREVDRRRIFCDEHNTDLNKQIYEFFVDLPVRPRGKYAYAMLGDYLKAKLGLSNQKRFIIKAPSGSGKSILMDMIGYLELTHFPGSFTIIGSISYPVATEHIRRIRQWVRNSLFGKYIHGMEATASKEEITLERSQSRMLAIASQAETSRSGYHPSLLLLDEVGRFRPQSYYQLFYQLGRSGGVLEIAGCYDNETEVLTEKGFKKFIDVLSTDKVGTMNLKTRDFEFQYPINFFEYPYDGDLVYIDGRNVNLKITPNHNVFCLNDRAWRKQKFEYSKIEAKKLLEYKPSARHYIPVITNPIRGIETEIFKIPHLDGFETTRGRWSSVEGKEIPMDLWLEFLGYYLSEGHVRENGTINISQKKFQSEMFFACKKIAEIINRNEIPYVNAFQIGSRELAACLPKPKRIPPYVYECSLRQRKIFLDAFDLGDGSQSAHKYGNWVLYCNELNEKELADDLQLLFISMGIATTRTYKGGHVIQVFGNKKTHLACDNRNNAIKSISYRGNVYCLHVPNETLIVRREGKVSVSGNSTPFLDSKIMMEFWNADDVQRYALELEDAWWISKEQIRNAEKTLPPELFDQLYRAKFRSISNRVIPDDLFLESISRGTHLPQSQNLLMGIDFGHKIDPTAVVVIDMETGDIKFATQFSDDWQIQFAKIRQLYQEWKPIKIEADSSSIGDVVISELSDLPIEGVSMHNDILKKRVIDRLTMAFINHKVNIVADEFPLLVSQLSSYVYLDQDHKKMGPSGRGHDDFVDALGLALMAFDVSSVVDMKQTDNIWTFTRVPGSNASPWKIGGF